MGKFKTLMGHLGESIRVSWIVSKWSFMLRIACEAVSVFVPIVLSYISKNVTNTLAAAGDSEVMYAFLTLILFFVVIQATNVVFGKANRVISAYHDEKVSYYYRVQIIEKINELDVSFFDDPEFYNNIHNSAKDSQSMNQLTWCLMSIVRGAIQAVSCGVILFGLMPVFPFVLLALSVPSALIDKKIAQKRYEWQRSRASNQRKIGYVESILKQREFAKDIRVYAAKDFLKKRFDSLWKSWFSERFRLEAKLSGVSMLISFLPQISSLIVLVYVGTRIIGGSLTLGDYSMYSSICAQYMGAIMTFYIGFNQWYESELKLNNYAGFLKLAPKVDASFEEKELEKIREIEFDHVSFRYGDGFPWVLRDFCIKISGNEKIAIVGPNGAGKTTMVKLLLRLYPVTEGEIRINGESIGVFTRESLYRRFGVMFQDYNNYQLSVRESVALSDKDIDDERVRRVCALAGLDVCDEKTFPSGTETIVGRIFDENGIELSGGQKQKMATARVLYRDSDFYILDEPNSSLDPESEARLISALGTATGDSGAIFITHRYSYISFVDRILVIKDGCCAESGTHEELIQRDGIYASLYRKQAEKFSGTGAAQR